MRYIRMFIALALLCAMVLGGCRSNPDDLSGESTTTPVTSSATAPQTQGRLDTAALTVETWDSGRANETSGNFVWETESGYYLRWAQMLYYADKSDLQFWVPVCAKPNCNHDKIGTTCDAIVPLDLLLKDNRFYYNTSHSFTAAFSDIRKYGYGDMLVSMALDGSDKRVEFRFDDAEEILLSGDSISDRSILFQDDFLYFLSALNDQGDTKTYIYLAGQEGAELLFSGTQESSGLATYPIRQMYVYGDPGFFSRIIHGSNTMLYRLVDGELTSVDLMDLPREGAYLQGDTLRIFRPGDGYYEVDLNTRGTVRLSDAQLSNSQAHIILPNCILESTLLGEYSSNFRSEVETHAMRMFNGEKWTDIPLPEELQNATDTTVLFPQAVTSDRILLICTNLESRKTPQLYQILLTTDTPTLEYLTDIAPGP